MDHRNPYLPETSIEDDAFGHEELAERLLDVARRPGEGCIIAVQASWGAGKTDLLARVARKSAESGPPVGDATAGSELGEAPAGSAHEVDLEGGSKETPPIDPNSRDPASEIAYWVNPWAGDGDTLLTLLVAEVAERLRVGGDEDKRAAEKMGYRPATVDRVLPVIRRAVNWFARVGRGLQALAGVVGAGVPGADAALALLEKVTEERTTRATPGAPEDDPRALFDQHYAAGVLLRDLCEAILGETSEGRILICVDDLDRCLPERQVAILQELYFLRSIVKCATILVALDHQSACRALRTHYQIPDSAREQFDADAYLQKIIDLRIDLAPRTPEEVGQAARKVLAAEQQWDREHRSLSDLLLEACGGTALASVVGQAITDDSAGKQVNEGFLEYVVAAFRSVRDIDPDGASPRMLRRVMERLEHLAALAPRGQSPFLVSELKRSSAGKFIPIQGDPLRAAAYCVVTWLYIIERWPDTRSGASPHGPPIAANITWEILGSHLLMRCTHKQLPANTGAKQPILEPGNTHLALVHEAVRARFKVEDNIDIETLPCCVAWTWLMLSLSMWNVATGSYEDAVPTPQLLYAGASALFFLVGYPANRSFCSVHVLDAWMRTAGV